MTDLSERDPGTAGVVQEPDPEPRQGINVTRKVERAGMIATATHPHILQTSEDRSPVPGVMRAAQRAAADRRGAGTLTPDSNEIFESD